MNEEPVEDNPVPPKNEPLKKLGKFVWSKISLGTILTAISLIAAYFYFDYTKKVQYTDRQIREKPELKIVKTELVTAHFMSEKFDTNNPPIDSSGILVLDGKVDIKFRFFIANVGKSRADIVGKMFLDTTSGDLIIRRDIESKSKNFEYHKIPDPYYPDQEIEAGDTIKDWHTFPIQFMKDSTFTIHYFLVYLNETGQVYDTYYREKFVLHSIPLVQDSLHAIPWNKIIESIDPQNSVELYSKKKGEEIFAYFEMLDEK